MINNIKISMQNFDSVDDNEFIIDNITVVKGFNEKDKSYLNKVAYSLLLSVSNESLNIASNCFKGTLVKTISKNQDLKFSESIYPKFCNNWNQYDISYEYLNKKFKEFEKLTKKYNMKLDYKRIDYLFDLYGETKKYRAAVLDHVLNLEIKNYNNSNLGYKVKVIIDDEYPLISEEGIKKLLSYKLEDLPGNLIYLDSTPIIDYHYNTPPYHYQELYYLLKENQIDCKIDTTDIINLIRDTLGGEFTLSNGIFDFITDNDEELLCVEDVSTGYKQLGVLQLLLQNRAIPEKSILIIDNIDYEMDEELQSKTAEILVKLANKLDLFIFINTERDSFSKYLNNYSDNIRNYEAIKNNDGKYTFKNEI